MSRVFLLLGLCALWAPVFAQDDGFKAAIEAGRAHFNKGEFDDALVEFAKARIARPTDWRGHAYQAMTHLQLAKLAERREKVVAECESAETLAAELVKKCGVKFTSPLYRYLVGISYHVKGDILGAYRFLEGAFNSQASAFAPYREIGLRQNVTSAFVLAGLELADRLIRAREFDDAEKVLARAAKLMAKDHPQRAILERSQALVCEKLGRIDEAIAHYDLAIEAEKNPGIKQALSASKAMAYLRAERIDEGRKVLESFPGAWNHPLVVVARCMLRYKVALRKPGSKAMTEALDYYRKVLPGAHPDNRYGLVRQFTDLVLAKVGPRELEKERKLVDETIDLALKENKRKPECPELYFALHRLYKLIGDKEKAQRFAELHEVKKKEFKAKSEYDERGRPRCG